MTAPAIRRAAPTIPHASMHGCEPWNARWPKCGDGPNRTPSHSSACAPDRSWHCEPARLHGGVARIVLWSPFQSGRAFIRELTATARLSAQDDVCDHDSETGINAEGYLFTDDTVADLKRWTVGDLPTSPAEEILILDREDRPVGPALESTLATAGAAVSSMSNARNRARC